MYLRVTHLCVAFHWCMRVGGRGVNVHVHEFKVNYNLLQFSLTHVRSILHNMHTVTIRLLPTLIASIINYRGSVGVGS